LNGSAGVVDTGIIGLYAIGQSHCDPDCKQQNYDSPNPKQFACHYSILLDYPNLKAQPQLRMGNGAGVIDPLCYDDL
jgi:hypothetical protein